MSVWAILLCRSWIFLSRKVLYLTKKLVLYKHGVPLLEPETFSVLDWRDSQLHHDILLLYLLSVFSWLHKLEEYIMKEI